MYNKWWRPTSTTLTLISIVTNLKSPMIPNTAWPLTNPETNPYHNPLHRPLWKTISTEKKNQRNSSISFSFSSLLEDWCRHVCSFIFFHFRKLSFMLSFLAKASVCTSRMREKREKEGKREGKDMVLEHEKFWKFFFFPASLESDGNFTRFYLPRGRRMGGRMWGMMMMIRWGVGSCFIVIFPVPSVFIYLFFCTNISLCSIPCT